MKKNLPTKYKTPLPQSKKSILENRIRAMCKKQELPPEEEEIVLLNSIKVAEKLAKNKTKSSLSRLWKRVSEGTKDHIDLLRSLNLEFS
jgi:hypothetical protein